MPNYLAIKRLSSLPSARFVAIGYTVSLYKISNSHLSCLLTNQSLPFAIFILNLVPDHSLFDLLFRPVSTPKTHVLNHQTVLFTLNIHRMWYCCVLVHFAGNGRNQTKSGENQTSGRTPESLTRVAPYPTRVASRPVATS